MKLLIQTQVYENYGYRWKAKGGNDYSYALGPAGRGTEALAEIVEYFRPKIECDNEHFREHIISFEVVADDFLTEFEQSQLEYDGRIAYPTTVLEMEEEAVYYGA
jgi:hypothetical protein